MASAKCALRLPIYCHVVAGPTIKGDSQSGADFLRLIRNLEPISIRNLEPIFRRLILNVEPILIQNLEPIFTA